MTASVVDQEIGKRYADGCDWGAKRRMIARTADGSQQLFIREGCRQSLGARGFGQTYCKAALILFTRRGGGYGGSTYLFEGRINNQTLRVHRNRIKAAFGASCPELDVNHTTIIG